MAKLIHQSTLIYYDNVQLAITVDEVDTKYLCLLVNDSAECVYCCIPISKKRLGTLLTNQFDLLTVFSEREADYWLEAATADIHEGISRTISRFDDIPSEYLPAPGLFVAPEGASDELVDFARERVNLVSELSVEPPEASDHVISAKTLSLLLDAYQSLVKRAVTAAKKKSQRRGVKPSAANDAHILDVYAFSPGSFKVRFEPRSRLDLLGDSEVQAAFELIEEVISKTSNPEAVAALLENYRGHFVTSLIKLLRVIAVNKTYLSFAWAKPSFRHVQKATIEFSSIASLLELLSKREEMLVEQVVLIGTLKKADADSGAWRLKNDEDGKEYSGTLHDPNASLSGLEIDSRYKVVCVEKIEDMPFTGREITSLQALDFSRG